jgi:hypothetical protein
MYFVGRGGLELTLVPHVAYQWDVVGYSNWRGKLERKRRLRLRNGYWVERPRKQPRGAFRPES